MPPETAPYYSPGDYAGFIRRSVIIEMDFVVLLMVGLVCAALHEIGLPDGIATCCFLGFSFAYLVLLERSSIGTLGHLLTGVRVVTLKGERPSVLRMTFRLLLWFSGPFHPLIDLWWLTGDEVRQTLRDKLAGTVVVRKSAVAAGTGAIRLNRYQFHMFSLVFYEVGKADPGITAT